MMMKSKRETLTLPVTREAEVSALVRSASSYEGSVVATLYDGGLGKTPSSLQSKKAEQKKKKKEELHTKKVCSYTV